MIENTRRPLILITVLLLTSLGLLLLLPQPFRLGLDLRGGQRIVLEFDLDEAREQGLVSDDDTDAEIIAQQIDIMRRRIDPKGVKDPIIRPEGTNRVVIELPGLISNVDRPSAPLGVPLPVTETGELILDDSNRAFEDFPLNGTVVIGDGKERIDYARRQGNRLLNLSRTDAAEHIAGERVELVSDDPIITTITNLGQLDFRIVVPAGRPDVDLTAERTKLTTWREANPDTPLEDFNALSAADGGPSPLIEWFPQAEQEDEAGNTYEIDPLPTLIPQIDDERFSGGDLDKVWMSQDDFGGPAVGFEMKSSERGRFGDFTGDNKGNRMAIILNGTIQSAPNLEGALTGSSRITGRFKVEEVRELITVLRTGSLTFKPEVAEQESVGPTLGAEYVRRGFWSGLIGISTVLVFMGVYYRRLGVFSMVSLISTVLMLMGAMAFLQATLTLPGIAGIILTVGMAVDANILIFDRMREERERGRNVKQAAKNGFSNAMSAILDANITTFLTAVILYKIGTGPVRGFAVTLMIGIVTSVISALILTRLLVHYALERGVREFKVGSLLASAKYKFLEKGKVAMACSAAFILVGLSIFTFGLKDHEKLGIDFLGGWSIQINTEEGQTAESIRGLVEPISTAAGRSVEVKPVQDEGLGDDKYTAFRLTYKTESDANEETEESSSRDNTFRGELEAVLAPVLQKGPVDIAIDTTGETPTANVTLYFEETHTEDDVAEALRVAGLPDFEVTPGALVGSYQATGPVSAAASEFELANRIETSLSKSEDSLQVPYTFSRPIPDSTSVGGQVVGELRDKAVLAMLVSLFVIVIYIRVRFAEYSYGFAAVAALAHDVLVTLGIIAIFNITGILRIEINLAMIAAFLTIIGYSLNDTIVVFDRVRENLPRMKGSLQDVLDASINQTLSRTLMTSLTTLLAVGFLFVFNVGSGNVLEGFAFAMLIGVLVGTYSSIFVACPVFHFFETRADRTPPSQGGETKVATARAPKAQATV